MSFYQKNLKAQGFQHQNSQPTIQICVIEKKIETNSITQSLPHAKGFSLEKESRAAPPETFLLVLMGQGLFSYQALASVHSRHVFPMNTTEAGAAPTVVSAKADLVA